jgi:hypothetical protein
MKYVVMDVYGYKTEKEERNVYEVCNSFNDALACIIKAEEDYYGPDAYSKKYAKFVHKRRNSVNGEKFIANSTSWIMQDEQDGYIIAKA